MHTTDLLSQQITEDYRVIPADHTLQLTNYFKNVARRVLADHYDDPEHHIRFVVSDIDKPDVFSTNNTDPPIIGISRGLLQTIENEDELAAAIASQAVHVLADNRFGARPTLKLEETASDIMPVILLQKAGYAPIAMATLLRKIQPDATVDLDAIDKVSGNNFSPAMRVRLAENAEVAQRRLTGSNQTLLTSLPDGLATEKFIGAKHQSYISQKMADANYAQLNQADKLKMLRLLVNKEDFSLSSQRSLDVARELGQLRIEHDDEQQIKAFDEFIDSILSHNVNLSERQCAIIYKAGQLAWNGGNTATTEPLGALAKLKTAMHNFKQARSAEDAENAGKVIHELTSRINLQKIRSITNNIDFPRFHLPSKGKITHALTQLKEGRAADSISLPWARHMNWATNASKETATAIGAGLTAMGVTEVRKLPVIGKIFKRDKSLLTVTSPRVEGEEHKDGEYHWRQLETTETHEVKDFYPDPVISADSTETLLLHETERLVSKTAKSQKAASEINWADMESDFSSFINRNSYLLTPERSVVEGKEPFAEMFVARLHDLVQQDPTTYRPIAHQFFTGKIPSKELIDNASTLRSLPKLIKKYNRMHDLPASLGSVQDMPFGVSPNHPYTRYVLDDPDKLFSAKEKSQLVSEVRYVNPQEHTWNIKPESIFGELPNNNINQLMASINHIRKYAATTHPSALRQQNFFMDVVQSKTKEFLEANPQIILNQQDFSKLNKSNTICAASSFTPEVSKLLSDNAFRKLAELAYDNADVETVINHFQAYSQGIVFLYSPNTQEAFERHIKRQLTEIEDPVRQGEASKQLLYTGISLRDRELREATLSSTVKKMAMQCGKDAGDAEYAKQVKSVIDDFADNLSTGALYSGLTQFADAITSQAELSYHMRDKLIEKGVDQQIQGHLASGGVELLIDTINADESLRQATIEFLKNPITKKNIDIYTQKISPELERLIADSSDNSFVGGLMDKGALLITPEMHSDFVKGFHNRIWEMPTAARVGLMEKILFPPSKDSLEQFSNQKQQILDNLIPAGTIQPAQANRKRRFFNRNNSSDDLQGLPLDMLANTLLEVNPIADQRLFLTGMMFAGLPNEDKEKSTNKAIAEGLMAMGPAGVKLAQAMDGIEKREGTGEGNFAESKKMSQKPSRWQVHEMMQTVPEPEDIQQHTRKVGKVLGAGAYGVTIMRERQDGEKTAVTVLPKYVRERAEYEFGNFERATRLLAERDPQFALLVGLVQEARHMANIETNMDIAAKQAELASQAYDNLGFEIQGQQVQMSTAPWIRHGKDFKETAMVTGIHFNDLPTHTPEQRKIKKIAGQAAWAAEKYIRLKGSPVDHDRHGAQQLIEMKNGVLHIRNFDFGAMDIEPPTVTQKEGLIDLLFGAAKDSALKRRPFSEAIAERVKSFNGNPEVSRYINTFARAEVAVSDFEAETKRNQKKGKQERITYINGKDRLQILGTIFKSGHVDPVIAKRLERHLGPARKFAIGGLKSMSNDNFRIIDRTVDNGYEHNHQSITADRLHNSPIPESPEINQQANEAHNHGSATSENSRPVKGKFSQSVVAGKMSHVAQHVYKKHPRTFSAVHSAVPASFLGRLKEVGGVRHLTDSSQER